MAGKRGIEGALLLAGRTRARRGGHERPADGFDRSTPDALAGWCGHYLDHLRARNYSEATVAGRWFCLKMFLGWAAERDVARAGQVTRPMLEAYQRWLWRYRQPRNGRPLGWSTQREKIGILKDCFRWLTRQNVIMHNPASELELPRPEKRLPQTALAPSEVERLLAVPDTADPLGVRDRAMLELFYSTGLRRTELCRLAFSDLVLERGTLTVRQGKGKKDRVVPVGEQARAWLERYLREARPRLETRAGEPALFLTGYGGPFNPDVVSYLVSAWMARAGLPKRGSCHLLRHTCATHMLEGGADIRYIQQLLGHENLESTAIYTEVSIKQLQEVHARCHPSGRLPAGPEENAASVAGENPAA
jgi:integrase/recombinase XerD